MEIINRIIHAITELHPIHPMFVHFPIALSGVAFFFIVLAHWKNNANFEFAAFANLALTAISTVVAGVTGMLDNIKDYSGTAPNASAKLILACLLFLLTAGISVARYRNPTLFQTANRFMYIAIYGLSFGIAITLAFLGGIILYGF